MAEKTTTNQKLVEEIERRVADYCKAHSTYTSDFSPKTIEIERRLTGLLAALLVDYHPAITAALKAMDRLSSALAALKKCETALSGLEPDWSELTDDAHGAFPGLSALRAARKALSKVNP